jgi:hypothetical protein
MRRTMVNRSAFLRVAPSTLVTGALSYSWTWTVRSVLPYGGGMSPSRFALLVLAGLLLCPAVLGAKGFRAECRRSCSDALHRCRAADGPTKRCRRQLRAYCRRNGPRLACRPSYSGVWTFTPTGEVTDTCGLLTGTDLTALTTMVVREETFGDTVTAEFGPGRDSIAGYLRGDGSTILEGETPIGGCAMVSEVFIQPSPSLPWSVMNGPIRSSGLCGEQTCCCTSTGAGTGCGRRPVDRTGVTTRDGGSRAAPARFEPTRRERDKEAEPGLLVSTGSRHRDRPAVVADPVVARACVPAFTSFGAEGVRARAAARHA